MEDQRHVRHSLGNCRVLASNSNSLTSIRMTLPPFTSASHLWWGITLSCLHYKLPTNSNLSKCQHKIWVWCIVQHLWWCLEAWLRWQVAWCLTQVSSTPSRCPTSSTLQSLQPSPTTQPSQDMARICQAMVNLRNLRITKLTPSMQACSPLQRTTPISSSNSNLKSFLLVWICNNTSLPNTTMSIINDLLKS